MLSEEFDLNYLKYHYDLSAAVNVKMHKTGKHGLLESLILSPIFEAHSKFFLRELHRLSDFSVLYYKHMTYYSSGLRDKPLLNMLQNLFPIIPRNKPEYDVELLKLEGEFRIIFLLISRLYVLNFQVVPHQVASPKTKILLRCM